MINIKHQQGSSLIEVLVALFILAVGLLGVLAMQSRAVQLNQNAYLYSQAAVLANDLMEAMRTSPYIDALDDYERNFGDAIPTETCGLSPPGCPSRVRRVPVPGQPIPQLQAQQAQIVQWNLSQWLSNIEGALPGGQGEVQITAPNTDGVRGVTIKVRFHIGYDDSNTPIQDIVTVVNGI
ncbi:type IV pilus modification protein PilV [Agarilytica rhodophyticola]|uniref:type IV pilus modification protein PilV n=1 Tax=Agarilytica rhodophyticola TaxID=1737490 RepID=UPI000B346C2F|nr:type IV pilus modification protein PilV [Agarilytica rhodophyticola]